MKIGVFLLVIGIVAGLVLYGYFKSVPSADNNDQAISPKIAITPKSFDFGEITYGEVAEHTFTLKNLGKKNLEIKKVATSCACTSAETSMDMVAPQEEIGLKVTYDTGAMSGPHGKGKQERIIFVKSNDPVNPQMKVMIFAYVK